MEDIEAEVNRIVKSGRKEIILIAQDTSKYGKDIYGKPMLAELIDRLCKIKELKWIRFLYTYPEDIDDKLIEVVKNNEKVCKYFDIPIQHISDRVLKRMNRKTTGVDIRKTINKLRENIPDVVIRTTIMVGFPGETEEEFDKTYKFLKDIELTHMHVFKYSPRKGTPAAVMENQVDPNTKHDRRDRKSVV